MWLVLKTIVAKYRPQLIGLAIGIVLVTTLMTLYVNALASEYEKGLLAGKEQKQKEWTTFWNAQVAKQDDRVQKLNQSAANASNEARTKIENLNQAIADLQLQLATKPKQTVVYTKENKPVQCKDEQGGAVEVYLGVDFLKQWNEINKIE